MSKIDDIKDIIQCVLHSPIHEFNIEYEGVKIAFKMENASIKNDTENGSQLDSVNVPNKILPETVLTEESIVPVDNDETPLKEIVSTLVGHFYASPDTNTPPYVKIGDHITEDSVVGLVEAMKLFTEMHAETSGEIVEILVKNGQLVEYGQPLFLIKPN